MASYPEMLAWLYGLQRFGIKLGLENMLRLCAALRLNVGNARVVHVAGTNGKGSVCAMIDAIARAAGYRSGLFTSPHLVTFRERIRINGEMISEDDVASGLSEIRALVKEWEPHPTFFEITTALAMRYFCANDLGLIVLETGLGGRLDATTAIPAHVAVITPIGFDHEKWLGDTIEKIAGEKAGIIMPRVPVVSAPQPEQAAQVIRARAEECNAPLQFVEQSYEESPVGLRGAHQKRNAALALAALRAADITTTDASRVRGLAAVAWPARFQIWNERIIIDGAHNPPSARILAETWREVFRKKRATLILAVLADKDVAGIWKELAPIADSVLLPRIRSERAEDPEKVAAVIRTNTPTLQSASPARTSPTPSIADALESAEERANPILITGSLHFAGEVLAHLRGEPAAFEECAQ